MKDHDRTLIPKLPLRIPRVQQHATEVVPERCRKCGNPWLTIEGREILCRGVYGGCGLILYVVRAS